MKPDNFLAQLIIAIRDVKYTGAELVRAREAHEASLEILREMTDYEPKYDRAHIRPLEWAHMMLGQLMEEQS